MNKKDLDNFHSRNLRKPRLSQADRKNELQFSQKRMQNGFVQLRKISTRLNLNWSKAKLLTVGTRSVPKAENLDLVNPNNLVVDLLMLVQFQEMRVMVQLDNSYLVNKKTGARKIGGGMIYKSHF